MYVYIQNVSIFIQINDQYQNKHEIEIKKYICILYHNLTYVKEAPSPLHIFCIPGVIPNFLGEKT